jgi:hypothetical protein
MLKSKTSLLAVDARRNFTNEELDAERKESLKDFVNIFIERYEEEIETRYSKNSEQKIAYAVLEIFRRRENIEKYNKKALYVLIREMTDERTQDISKVVNVIKKEFNEKLFDYNKVVIKVAR